MTFSFRPVLAIAVGVSLVILFGLGLWQWQKIGPKTALQNSIKDGLSAEPLKLAEAISSSTGKRDLAYRRVTATGRFTGSKPLRLVRPSIEGQAGYHLYGLFETVDGLTVLTSPGFIPFEAQSLPSLPTGKITVSGVLIPEGRSGPFTPEDQVDANRWYTARVDTMSKALGFKQDQKSRILDFRLMIDDQKTGFPIGGQVFVDIKNDHLQYAFTWWGLALSLIAVYCAFSISGTSKPD